jgi:hypothetical protein
MRENQEMKCCRCGISKHREEGYTIQFWKITDQYGNDWHKPYGEKDKYYFGKISKTFLNYAKTKKNTDIWKEDAFNADIKYNYSTTIHKSQGSEWEVVFVDRQNIIKCCNDDERLKLHSYYTAVSRMREKVFEIGDSCAGLDFFDLKK